MAGKWREKILLDSEDDFQKINDHNVFAGEASSFHGIIRDLD